ncbi:MAG: hypothetical protein ACOYB2_10780 [Limnohabitans sp.]
MGADLLLHHVWIAKGKEPDWQAAKDAIAAMDDEKVQKLAEQEMVDDDVPAYREQLLADIAEVEDVWHKDRRTAYKCPLGPIDCLITGGISWGDSPDEFFDVVGRFLETPAVEAAGFFVWPAP